ncbi:MAG: hypothetical protein JW703_01610, partial [Candidatus Diapherotrites archaeon]|nr:hypothetical protein [Candidatus Diapherotrites archaeon]
MQKKIKLIKMNSKGFTLFTALVSFILIVLAVLVTQSMLGVESNAITVMSDLEEQSELQAIVDLARADALQTFNYDIRYALESYFQAEANNYPLDETEKTLEDIKKGFINQFFVGTTGNNDVTAFANRLASALENTLANINDPRGYTITLKTSPRQETTDTMVKAMQKSQTNDKFMEIITCGEDEGIPFDKCDGSFYINLDFASISNEDYEKLPALEIRSNSTGRTIRQPIIPRGNMRIYVPIRIFKVFEAGRLIEFGENGNNGILTANYSNSIENYKLGFCDGCGPKTNPIQSGSSTWNPAPLGTCPKEGTPQPIGFTGIYKNFGFYNDTGNDSMKSKLEEIVEKKLLTDSEQIFLTVFRNSSPYTNTDDTDPVGLFELAIESDKIKAHAGLNEVRENTTDSFGMNCSFMNSYEVVISFTENNPKYKVLKDKTPVYRVVLRKNFTGAAPTPGTDCKTDSPNCVPD